jgi:hypothetical protein
MPPRKRLPRGHIEELSSGSFRAIVYAGIDPITRKSRYLKETARTYEGAGITLTKLQSQVDDERHLREPSELPVAVWQEAAARAYLQASLSPDGSTPYKPRLISQRYRRPAARLALRSTRFHVLRHYSATELIAARVDVRTVAGRLGQSDGGASRFRLRFRRPEPSRRRVERLQYTAFADELSDRPHCFRTHLAVSPDLR